MAAVSAIASPAAPSAWCHATSLRLRTALTLPTSPEVFAQLSARADAELAVGRAEVTLDGLLGHEQRLGDLAVAEALRRQVGDAELRRRQRLPSGQRGAARFRSGLDESVAGFGGE